MGQKRKIKIDARQLWRRYMEDLIILAFQAALKYLPSMLTFINVKFKKFHYFRKGVVMYEII